MKLELDEKPLKPTIIEGFPGFGFVSTIVTEYLIKSLDAKPIGRINSEKISPIIAIHDSKVIHPLEIFYDKKTNIVIVQAITPIEGLEWEIAESILKLAKETKAKEIIGLEGVNTMNPQNINLNDPQVFYYTNKKSKLKDIKELNEGVILGVTGALLTKVKDTPFTSFFVEANSNFPDNKAASKIILALDSYLGLKIDYKPLIEKAKEFEDKIKGFLTKVAEAKVQKDQRRLDYMG